MIELRIARGSRPTGNVLAELLAARRLQVRTQRDSRTPDGIVSFGVPVQSALPTLNGNAGIRDKFEQGLQLTNAGVRIVPHYSPTDAAQLVQEVFPLLARQRDHVGGRDIMLALEPADVQRRVRAGAQFFTQFIPSRTEFRVWIYRRRHLGTYEKVLAHPERYKKIGRNFDNGFAFQLVPEASIPRAAVELASEAVEALGLDFGAVDILQDQGGNHYVLEVNSAPGVEGPDRQVIQALANRIAKWVELGYPARRGTRA